LIENADSRGFFNNRLTDHAAIDRITTILEEARHADPPPPERALAEAREWLAGIETKMDDSEFLGNPKTFIPAYSGTGRRPSRRKLRRKDSQPKTVAEIANSNNISWTSQVLAEGAKGPIHAQVARLQVYPSHEGLPRDTAVWLFLRRSSDGEIKYAFSNAPEDIPLEDMCHAATLRWGIEQCFQEGKGQLGMDHYEHRSWPAWHRHMIYVFLGLHFLLRVRLRFKKNSNAHLAPSQPIDGGRVAASLPE